MLIYCECKQFNEHEFRNYTILPAAEASLDKRTYTLE